MAFLCKSVKHPQKGRQKRNLARKLLCIYVSDWQVQHYRKLLVFLVLRMRGGVSNALTEIRKLISMDRGLEELIESIV